MTTTCFHQSSKVAKAAQDTFLRLSHTYTHIRMYKRPPKGAQGPQRDPQGISRAFHGRIYITATLRRALASQCTGQQEVVVNMNLSLSLSSKQWISVEVPRGSLEVVWDTPTDVYLHARRPWKPQKTTLTGAPGSGTGSRALCARTGSNLLAHFCVRSPVKSKVLKLGRTSSRHAKNARRPFYL